MDREQDAPFLRHIRSLSIRAALVATAKEAGDKLAAAVAPDAWIEAQTKAALLVAPGETLAERFQRLGNAVRDLTQNNPAGLSARHEAGNKIAQALKVETAEHILTHEGLIKQADELDANWDEAKQAAFDKRLENHVAAAHALWGYDPIDVERTLHARDEQSAAREWAAMPPVEREHLRQFLASEITSPSQDDLKFSVFVQAYQGDAAKAQDEAWAKGLTDRSRAEHATATASLILENNNDLRGGQGIDGDRDARLRRQLGLLADTRMSDAVLDHLRAQEVTLEKKIQDCRITGSEWNHLQDIRRQTALAEQVNHALYSVAHGLDFSKAETLAVDQLRLNQILDNGEHVELSQNTPEWERAQEGLRQHLQTTGLGDGTTSMQRNSAQLNWRLVASAELDGEIAHIFRHERHPYTGDIEIALVGDGGLGQQSEREEPQLQAANAR